MTVTERVIFRDGATGQILLQRTTRWLNGIHHNIVSSECTPAF